MQLGQLGPGNYCATIERHSEGQWLALGQQSVPLQLVSDVNSLSHLLRTTIFGIQPARKLSNDTLPSFFSACDFGGDIGR